MLKQDAFLKDFYNQALQQHKPTHIIDLQLSDYIFRVKTNSEKLLKKLQRYFNEFLPKQNDFDPTLEIIAIEATPPDVESNDLTVKQPDPGKKKIKEEFFNTADGRLVRKRLTGMVFLFGKDFHMGIGPAEKNDNQIVNFINNRLLELRLNQGALLGHAAAVMNPSTGKGAMFAGFSGMGKSTLSLEVMNHGTTFVSNDRILITPKDGNLYMEGVAKHPRINPGTIIHNPSLDPLVSEEDRKRYEAMGDELWDLEEKYDGFIDTCYGENKFVLNNNTHFLILLNWKRNDEPFKIEEIQISERRDLLPAFMKETGLFYLPNSSGEQVDRSEEAYVKMLETIKVYELSGGVDFQSAAKFTVEILSS